MTDPIYDFVRYYSEDGTAHAIRKRGRKHFHLVMIDHPISVTKVQIDGAPYMAAVPNYGLGTAIERFFDASVRCGITEGAKEILTSARDATCL